MLGHHWSPLVKSFIYLKQGLTMYSGLAWNSREPPPSASCMLEQKEPEKETGQVKQVFCFLKGMLVECSEGRVQDCNIKRVRKCPKD